MNQAKPQYSRIFALKDMDIVNNISDINKKTIIIVGVGGIGSVAAEMLVRCGIGKLILIDYDTVEIENMNRLFFRPSQCGLTKTEAAYQTLHNINEDICIERYSMDITKYILLKLIQKHGLENTQVDLVLSCVDNYAARITINSACCKMNQPWMESGVSEDAFSGHIQLMLPGRTACFQCVPPYAIASGMDESTIKRGGVCTASLPTTMGIVAGFLVQNTLKFLLQFGQISYYLGYSALNNCFTNDIYLPCKDCCNDNCKKLQNQYSEKWSPSTWKPPISNVIEEDNIWGITYPLYI